MDEVTLIFIREGEERIQITDYHFVFQKVIIHYGIGSIGLTGREILQHEFPKSSVWVYFSAMPLTQRGF